MTPDTDDPEWSEVVGLMRQASAKSRGYAGYWEWAIDRPRAEEHAASVLVHFLITKDELVSAKKPDFQKNPRRSTKTTA